FKNTCKFFNQIIYKNAYFPKIILNQKLTNFVRYFSQFQHQNLDETFWRPTFRLQTPFEFRLYIQNKVLYFYNQVLQINFIYLRLYFQISKKLIILNQTLVKIYIMNKILKHFIVFDFKNILIIKFDFFLITFLNSYQCLFLIILLLYVQVICLFDVLIQIFIILYNYFFLFFILQRVFDCWIICKFFLDIKPYQKLFLLIRQ
ncbi:hypothetical protein IMG5_033530, partial [Ichthyophthirius multifiliis]